jgi:tetratricopeptide (TPR) repeat protein
MSNLATTYNALGRHQDALVMLEKTLEEFRRVLPENHPDIGVMWLCLLIYLTCDLTRSFLGNAMSNLAFAYGGLGRHQDALVMQVKTLEFQRRVLPENHLDIGVM